MEPIDGKIAPQPGPQEQFLSSPADIVIYGGAAGGGKSACLLIEPLRNATTPGFNALVLRREREELLGPGALWGESETIYPLFGGTQKISTLSWTFPSGAGIKFAGMKDEADKLKYQGREFALIEFDELTHFEESQFWYMESRNRSMCGVKPYMRASCNPDADSWVASLIEWWIDQNTGYAIPERSGVVRWFLRSEGQLVWANSPNELVEKYPDRKPRSLTFIAAKLSDNKILTSKDPDYLSKLESLPYVDRERLLGGNWKVQSGEGAEWPGEYFGEIWGDYWPDAFTLSAMACDPSKGRQFGDYAAIVFAGVAGGLIWVDAILAKIPAPKIAEEMVEMYFTMRPNYAGLEANMNQDTSILPMIDECCEQRGLPPMPVHLFQHTGAKDNKERRIFQLGPYIKSKKIKLRRGSPGCKILEQQLRAFPKKEVNDDGPDALQMAIELLNMLADASRLPSRTDHAEQLNPV